MFMGNTNIKKSCMLDQVRCPVCCPKKMLVASRKSMNYSLIKEVRDLCASTYVERLT